MNMRDKLRRENRALKVECAYCGSARGNRCVTKDGFERHAHERRVEDSKEAAEEKARGKQKKNCPCHGRKCAEHAMGGTLCGPGACVRMN